MKNMTLTAIAQACNGKLIGDLQNNKEVAGVVIDSRKIEKDFLFIATVGERVDGHDFIDEVFEKGAMAVICEKPLVNAKGPYIIVESSFLALANIAKWYRMQLNIKVVGITGSVGKTTTKEFISSVLTQKYNVLKTEGNYNNEVGLPLTILRIREEHEVAVIEMGISDFGEMHRLSEVAKPDICVLTNIGLCHLDKLGTRQGILKAKSEIFDFMNDDGFVCINGDDDMLVTINEVKGRKPMTFGLGAHNDVYATSIEPKGFLGSSCEIHLNNKSFHTDIPQPGEHMVLNALAATTVGNLLHMTSDEISTGIKAVQSIGGRSNIIRKEQWTIIDDCYNASPVSMKAALDLLSLADTNKVAILGDMFELGNDENTLHKEIGAYAASKDLDIIICVGNLSSNMYDGAAQVLSKTQNENEVTTEQYKRLLYFKTRDELITALPSILKKDDTILVKASHGMGFEHVVKALQ